MLTCGDRKKGEIEIIKQNIVFSNEYVKVYNDDVIFPAGNYGTYIRITSPSNKSVAVLPITKDGKIVVIRNYRHGVRGWGIEVPKGAVEFGESNKSAALRELAEETGYECTELIHVCEYGESPAIFGNKMDCFVALGCQFMGRLSQESTEAIDKVFEISLGDLLKRNYEADFIDAISELLAWQYFVKNGGYVL